MNKAKEDLMYNESDLEKVAIDVVKFLLERNVPFEDIQQLSGKSIEEIKRIGGIID